MKFVIQFVANSLSFITRALLFLGVGCFISGCDLTAFGGMAINRPHDVASGFALGGVFVSEVEVGRIGTQFHYSLNARLPLGLPESEELVWFPYFLGGGGKVEQHFAWNCGGGFGLAPWRLAAKWQQTGPVLRLDYRYFGVDESKDIHRIYIGLWKSIYDPLFID
jgi:hypothetical protein